MTGTCDKSSRLNDRLARLLEKTRYRCVRSTVDKDEVFALRYEAYMREGGIAANSSGRFSDPLDDVENVWIVAMDIDGELASSIRLHVATSCLDPLPTSSAFGDAINLRLATGKRIVDPTRHVARLEMSRRFPELPYLTIRAAWMAGAHFDADYVLAAVRTEHQPFYERVFGHQAWTAPRPYPLLTKPIVCLGMDYQALRSGVEERYPFFRSSLAERTLLFSSLPAAGTGAPWSRGQIACPTNRITRDSRAGDTTPRQQVEHRT